MHLIVILNKAWHAQQGWIYNCRRTPVNFTSISDVNVDYIRLLNNNSRIDIDIRDTHKIEQCMVATYADYTVMHIRLYEDVIQLVQKE